MRDRPGPSALCCLMAHGYSGSLFPVINNSTDDSNRRSVFMSTFFLGASRSLSVCGLTADCFAQHSQDHAYSTHTPGMMDDRYCYVALQVHHVTGKTRAPEPAAGPFCTDMHSQKNRLPASLQSPPGGLSPGSCALPKRGFE